MEITENSQEEYKLYKNKERRRQYMKKYMEKYNPIRNPLRHKHKGKHNRIDIIRIGVCNWCRKVAGIDCHHTQWHHEQYDETDISKYTIELCPKCHANESGLGVSILSNL